MIANLVPTRMALEYAHRFLGMTMPIDDALDHPTFRPILEIVARGHMQRLARLDVKRLQANDLD